MARIPTVLESGRLNELTKIFDLGFHWNEYLSIIIVGTRPQRNVRNDL
jgi:hypothetical protein